MPVVDPYTNIKNGKLKVNVRSPIEHRFWRSVDKNGPVHPVHGQCWIWVRCCSRGYGQIRHGDRLVKAHRYSYTIHIGDIPSGLLVCHKCNNKKCINPNHLFVGTDRDNALDKVSKGRQSRTADGKDHRGVKNFRAKLTEEDVHTIRMLYKLRDKKYGARALSKKFKITSTMILYIVKRHSWVHI